MLSYSAIKSKKDYHGQKLYLFEISDLFRFSRRYFLAKKWLATALLAQDDLTGRRLGWRICSTIVREPFTKSRRLLAGRSGRYMAVSERKTVTCFAFVYTFTCRERTRRLQKVRSHVRACTCTETSAAPSQQATRIVHSHGVASWPNSLTVQYNQIVYTYITYNTMVLEEGRRRAT
jgi:hypothetical protein